MLSTLLFAISCLLIFLPAWVVASRLFRHQLLAGALLYLCLVLCQITAIELILGITHTLKPIGMVVGALLIGVTLWWGSSQILAHSKSNPNFFSWGFRESLGLPNFVQNAETPVFRKSNDVRLNSVGIAVIAIIVIVVGIPLYPTLRELWLQIILVHPLSWDVVSYHLPNVLDYIHVGSLWPLEGAFNQYPGGNELLQIWSFLPLKVDALLGITTATLGLGVMLAATLILGVMLPRLSPFESGIWAIALWLLCLSVPPFQDMLFDFGRNDLTIAFWQLVTLWTLQKAATQTKHRNWWMLGTGVSLGMAVGVKPNGLYYLPIVVGLVFARFFPAPDSDAPWRSKALAVFGLMIIPTCLLGGFWYLRNLVVNGVLFQSELVENLANLSILKNLLNPGLYQLNLPFFLFMLSLSVTGGAIALCIAFSSQLTANFKLLTGFNALAIGALILTPSGAGYWAGSTPVFLIQIRYSASMVPLTIILLLFFLFQLRHRFHHQLLAMSNYLQSSLPQLHHQSQPPSTALFLGLLNLIGLGLLVMQLFSYQPPTGLPGFDRILFASNPPPSQVYAWVQKNLSNTSIYSIGLRPYGLYGFPFSNRVIYNLGSSDWNYQEGLRIIRKFKPQFIAISLDPFTGQPPKDIALLIRQPQIFEAVYQDSLSVVFRVSEIGQPLAD